MTDLLGSGVTPTPASSSPPVQTQNGPGTSGSFPQGSLGNSPLDIYLPTAQSLVNQMNATTGGPGRFASDYGVSSSEMATFLDPNGKLNSSAAEWVAYHLMSPADRRNLQTILETAGLLKSTDVTGIPGSASNSAFRSLLGVAASQGVSTDYLVTQINQGGLGAVQDQISANLNKAQALASSPVTASLENPTTLAATITSAFDNALGYAPDQKQIQSFISQIQGQDAQYAQAPHQEAQALINQATAQESALNKLGPDGIDTVIQAYQAAVTGTKLPGAGTPQGPVSGALPNPTNPTASSGQQAPGTPLPPGVAQHFDANGNLVGANLMPTPDGMTQQPVQPGLFGQLENYLSQSLGHGTLAPATQTVTKYQLPQRNAPSMPAGVTNSTTTYGGTFALSNSEWAKAQALYPSAKKYTTPGAAPQSIQLGAFTALLQNEYDTNGGNWGKAVTTIATGTPLGKSQGPHLVNFATGVANEVNNQISALQSQVDNTTVTTKVTAPDAVAEANNAAKTSDPVGYYAANYASGAELLNQMLAGAPLMYSYNNADTFTGPVSAAVAGTASSSAPPPAAAKP